MSEVDPTEAAMAEILSDGVKEEAAPGESAPAEAAVEPAPEQTVNEEEYERAVNALTRYHAPRDVVEKLPKEAALKWGAKLSKMQSDYDSMKTDLHEFKARYQEAKSQGRPADKPEAPRVDLRSEMATLKEQLGLDEKAGKALDVFGSKIEELERRAEAAEQRISSRDKALESLVVESTRGRLRERFPGLEDEARMQNVIARAQKLSKTGEYDNLSDMFEDACKYEFFDDMTAGVAKSKAASTNRIKEIAKPHAPSQRRPVAVQSWDERARGVFDEILGEAD